MESGTATREGASTPATFAEAFRITAARHAERGRRPHARTTTSRSPGPSCASASTRSPAGWPSSASSAGECIAIMLDQPPRVPPRRPRRVTSARRRSRSTTTSRPSRSSTSSPTPSARIVDHRAGVPRPACSRRASELPDLEHVIVVDGDAPEGSAHARRARGLATPTSTSTPRVARGRARRPADADLHVGHDRPAEGRPAHARATC